jgi:hypothetical protein
MSDVGRPLFESSYFRSGSRPAGDSRRLSGGLQLRAQPVDATPPFLTGSGLKFKVLLRRGLAMIRCCTCTSERDQRTALLAISINSTSTCYCVAET